MSVVTRNHLTEVGEKLSESKDAVLRIFYMGNIYSIPKVILYRYKEEDESGSEFTDDLFADLDRKYTKAGALLKGLRYREGLTQVEFARKIGVTQADLSKMEKGIRPIGKIIAKRIQKAFAIDYRYFLE